MPAAFLALLWPQISSRRLLTVAVVSALLAITLTPLLAPGLPVLCAAIIPFFFLQKAAS